MFNFIEEFKNDLENSAIKSTFRKIFNCDITYGINEEDNILVVQIRNKEKLEKEKYDLPTLEQVKKSIKKQYKKSNVEKIEKIIYYFSFCNDCRNLYIDAKNSDVYIAFSNCNSLKITGAENVDLRYATVKDNIEIDSKQVDFEHINILINGNSNIKADTINFWNTKIHTPYKVNLNSQKLKFKGSLLFAISGISLNADKIDVETSEFSTGGELIINDKNGDEIPNVYASKVIYNGIDISNSEKIIMPKLKQRLINDLYKIRNNILINIENEIKIESEKLKQNLNNKPISKVLKK